MSKPEKKNSLKNYIRIDNHFKGKKLSACFETTKTSTNTVQMSNADYK